MNDKISDKDKIDWENFLKSKEKLLDKDYKKKPNVTYTTRSIDLHGYTLEEANRKICEFIENCYVSKVKKVNVITGKGMRSKNLDDPYQSKDLSILKYSVPEYIKNNSELMNKIIKIDFESVNSPSKGNFDIFLKTIK